jgi:hypothetical protein
MGLLFVFIDGVGIGPPGDANPLTRSDLPLLGVHADRLSGDELDGLPAGWRGTPIDATLGVTGIPQSATGQTTLLTGVNAAACLGYHQSAVPGMTLRRVLLRHSILKRVTDSGLQATFANAFRPRSLELLEDGAPRRAPASTLATWASAARFRTLGDLAEGKAVYHDITRETLRRGGFGLPDIAPEEAGRNLAAIARVHDLTVWEHFLTDLAGHARDAAAGTALLQRLEAMIAAAASDLDPDRDGVVVTSDHGNLEDVSVRTHTRYPVPFLIWGRMRRALDRRVADLSDVAPSMLCELGIPSSKPGVP